MIEWPILSLVTFLPLVGVVFLLLIRGDHDTVLPHAASQDIYERARDPKRLVLLEGAGHSLRERPTGLFDELDPYLLQAVGPRDSD